MKIEHKDSDIHPAVTYMARIMLRELEENYAKKGGRDRWLSLTSKEMVKEIFYHVGKLQAAVGAKENDATIEFAADVCNCVMILLDKLDLLGYPKKPKPPERNYAGY